MNPRDGRARRIVNPSTSRDLVLVTSVQLPLSWVVRAVVEQFKGAIDQLVGGGKWLGAKRHRGPGESGSTAA